MQPVEVFLTFYLGHLIADFLLQSKSMIARKLASRVSGYLEHGALHYAAIVVVVGAAAPSYLLQLRLQAVVLGLTGVHLLIDWAKIRLSGGWLGDGAFLFLADQAVHLATVGAAAALFAQRPFGAVFELLRGLSPERETILAVLVVYVATVFGTGYLIRMLIKSLLGRVPSVGGESREELENAGLYIGWLERVLVLTAVILRSPATIGLVLAAKSIVRYPELKTPRFAEYFLIGTLLSIVLAIFGGVILLKVLYGAIRFAS